MLFGDYHFYKNQLVLVIIQIYENQNRLIFFLELVKIGQLLKT